MSKYKTRPRCRIRRRDGRPCPAPVAPGNVYTCRRHHEREAGFTQPEYCAGCAAPLSPERNRPTKYCQRRCRPPPPPPPPPPVDEHGPGPACARCGGATWHTEKPHYICSVCGYLSDRADITVPGRIVSRVADVPAAVWQQSNNAAWRDVGRPITESEWDAINGKRQPAPR